MTLAVVVVLALAAAGTPRGVSAGERHFGSAPVPQGARLWDFHHIVLIVSGRMRVSSGACDASPDSAVVLEGPAGVEREGDLAFALQPVGAAAMQLAASSPLNGIVVLRPVTLTIPEPDGTELILPAFDLFVQVYRETGLPGVTVFTVCGV